MIFPSKHQSPLTSDSDGVTSTTSKIKNQQSTINNHKSFTADRS